MTPEPKKPVDGEPLEDEDLKKVSGGIKFHDPISGDDRGNDDVPPPDDEGEGGGNDNGGPPVFVKPVYDPED